ncbi:MAG: pimB 2, partial [Verrucomicrobiales bacterium]|nr:pimB 2 [Verrucomicrobiales bacterium]
IEVIQHGIPDLKLSSDEIGSLREIHGWGMRPVMLTFGLLSPNKGIEHAIRALPGIVRDHPGLLYVVAGATHPNLVREQGEAYRDSLISLAEELGVSANVQFINRFVSEKELVALIGAADLYLTPYLNEAQITSGTLAFAFGLGKPVISTPYWYAEEMLSDGAGILVPFSNSEGIAAAASALLGDEEKRSAMSAIARERGASMGWKHVGTQYADLMENAFPVRRSAILTSIPARAKSAAAAAAAVVPFIHLERMTGEFGIFQHASFKQPDPVHGFCADDNARVAILLASMEQEDDRLSQPVIASLRTRCVASLSSAYNPRLMRFRNFMNIRGQWLEDCGSEDSHGRVLWALGILIGKMPSEGRSSKMVTLFLEAALSVRQFSSPRAWAFTLMGLAAFAGTRIAEPAVRQLQRQLSEKLLTLHRNTAGPRWNWFEDVITYDNAKIPEALLVTWEQLQTPALLETGLSTLEFLLEEQTAPRGHFRPVGCNGFWVRGGAPARFDQQPLEAQAMVAATLKAATCTRERAWVEAARDIHRWFTGYNDHGIPVADAREGGCHDGLTPGGVNGNMGAESTLAFLQSSTDLQAAAASFALHAVRPANITPLPLPARERGQMIPA